MPSLPSPLRKLAAPVRALFVGDAAAGIVLIAVAAAAMLAANSPLSAEYHQMFYGKLAFTPVPKLDTLHLWINDGLMAVFFFVVGLEVKRELVEGQLSDPAQRNLPIVAAIAGMAAPACVYMLVAGGAPGLDRGWAIPAATDIAFAMGVLGLLGNRVPSSLRIFLLTVAIVDDMGAVAVIALFYTPTVKVVWLLAAAMVLAVLIVLNRAGIGRLPPYVILGVLLWYCVLHSGIHATVAGVAAALAVPMQRRDGTPVLARMEHGLAPWSAYLVVPVFGFANAGVSLSGVGPAGLLAPLPLGVAAGLIIGKQIGILGGVWLAERTGFAPRPEGASWLQLWGVGALCGIGFTMSLFISDLAFGATRLLVDEAKLGILAGSLVSAVLGFTVLRLAGRGASSADAKGAPETS